MSADARRCTGCLFTMSGMSAKAKQYHGVFVDKKGDVFKKFGRYVGVPVYYGINGIKSKNRSLLEMAKSEDSENTTHVDFG